MSTTEVTVEPISPPAPTVVPPPTPSPISPAPIDPTRRPGALLPTRKVGLGEELPVFCEKCGYALHGLPQAICDNCTIRHFRCPECGHHQPINTLRPAAQKLLGRVRSLLLAFTVFFKLNYFGWLLVAWVAMGYEWTYRRDYNQANLRQIGTPIPLVANPGVRVVGPGARAYAYGNSTLTLVPREATMESMLAFSLFAVAFGMVSRMFLLRWRHGYKVGLTLSAVILAAIILGAYLHRLDTNTPSPHPWGTDFLLTLATTTVSLTLGASVVWGIWTALVHVFLPRRTAEALLDWQRTLSNPPAATLARE